VCQNILFKFALDSSGLYGSDEAAMKSASNELKGLMSYYNLQLDAICFPLCVAPTKETPLLFSLFSDVGGFQDGIDRF
jgi:hypothetical protein